MKALLVLRIRKTVPELILVKLAFSKSNFLDLVKSDFLDLAKFAMVDRFLILLLILLLLASIIPFNIS